MDYTKLKRIKAYFENKFKKNLKPFASG